MAEVRDAVISGSRKKVPGFSFRPSGKWYENKEETLEDGIETPSRNVGKK